MIPVPGDRWLDLDGVVNMRDLGGLPTRDGRVIRRHRLIRSDNLGELTAESVTQLIEVVGVSDVVDLRSLLEVTEEGPGALGAGVRRHHHSLFREDGPPPSIEEAATGPWANPSRHGTRDARFWSQHYLGFLDDRPDSVSAALRAIGAARGATIVHCAAGKDRTGTIVALALDVAGVPHEEIVADYLLTTTRLPAILARLLTRPIYGPALAAQPASDQTPQAATMESILRTLDQQWGGARGWLRTRGWTDDELDGLRERLVD